MYSKVSPGFIIARGLKTGGSLSSLLWLIYFDDLLIELKNLPGIKITRTLKVNTAAFADDLVN